MIGEMMNAVDLNPKNLINIGVFTAISFVITFISGMLGLFGPGFMFVAGIVTAILNPIVMMVFLSRTKTIGALTIYGFLFQLLFLATGHSWYGLILGSLFGFIGDLVNASGQFQSRWRTILGYAICSLSYISPIVPIFINGDAYFKDIADTMGVEYANQMAALFTPTTIIIFSVVTFFLNIFGGYLGMKLIDKQFSRAGIA